MRRGSISGSDRAVPDGHRPPAAAVWGDRHKACDINGDPITVLAIIVLILLASVALTVLSLAAHVLFSPWLLLAAVGILVWVKFRPRHARQ